MQRNLLIEAGAGTGKTTRLVKAVLEALFIRQIPLEKIVALTFTNKAAGELKERVGAALEDVRLAVSVENLRLKPWWPSSGVSLTLSDLKNLAEEATGVLDRANISTIHSFAFSLLKRFPLASGIDPEAAIDDKGLLFGELFDRQWPRWLAVELGENAPHEAQWLELLSKLTLSDVREAVHHLADFQAPIETLKLSREASRKRLAELHAEAKALAAAHPGKLNADQLIRSCEEILGAASTGEKALDAVPSETREAIQLNPGSPKSWPSDELARLKSLQTIAKSALAGSERVIALLSELLEPFIRHFRKTLLTEGCLTHSALLFLSRDMVKSHPDIRAALKRDIRFILIDEFQDTDPLQAELLLYLAELPDRAATDWRKVQLEPGKLFIVGDPKQSIYRFRGADIAAYEQIGNLVAGQGGLRETLEVNYRSQSQIIHVVNRAFERMIRHEPELSPPYAAVRPHHPYDAEQPLHDVEIWLAESDEKQSVEQAQTTEAENIARWIKERVGEPSDVRRRTQDDGPRTLLYRDIALIFRTYSPMDRFIEALRRHDIPFAVESERFFFTTPEVTDFINLLRAAADPDDTLSLIGYLRGSLGGISDEEILRRRQQGTLEDCEPVRWLRSITARLSQVPLGVVLTDIFENSYLLEMAARSYHGDQTLANLSKLKRLLEGYSAQGDLTLAMLLEKLDLFFDDDKIEGESPLADESFNAVRLLTIHKAKGLEYPVVFLPSLHSELRPHKPEPFVYDWRSQKWGLRVAGHSNLDKLDLDEQTRRREAAEENRILYVAMTRARERLILSGGINLKSGRSRTYFQRLLEAWDLSLDALQEGKIQLPETTMTVRRLPRVLIDPKDVPESLENPLKNVDPEHFAKVWRERAEQRRLAEGRMMVIAPSQIAARTEERGVTKPDPLPSSLLAVSPIAVGVLSHRFLELWDFSCKKFDMPARLRQIARKDYSDEVIDSAQKLLAGFIGSDAYNEIAQSEILGREIPFFYKARERGGGRGRKGSPHKENLDALDLDHEPLVRGTIDILYRTPSGELIIGDYKTVQVQDETVYESQKTAYQTAIERSIGVKSVFKIIYLRA